jgi:hypothetical protein
MFGPRSEDPGPLSGREGFDLASSLDSLPASPPSAGVVSQLERRRQARARPSRRRALPAPRGAPAADGGVDARLIALARSNAPLRWSLAAIAGRLVSLRAWERLGFARLRDYAVERTGLSARQVQDLARMDAAFAQLPLCEAAFLAGSLSWTKARLIARVATPEDEADWLAAAQRMTARALAREVRAVDARAGALATAADALATAADALATAADGLGTATDEDGALEEPRETVFLRCAPGVRAQVSRARLLVKRITGESLPTWACMEAVAAEVLSAIPLDGPAADGMPPLRLLHSATEAPWPAARKGLPRARANPKTGAVAMLPDEPADSREKSRGALERALPPALRNLVCGLDDADPFDLDERLRRAMQLEQVFEAQLAPLLLEVANGRRWHAAWVEHARRVSVRCLEDDVELSLVAAAEVGAAALDPAADPQTGARPMPPPTPQLTTRFFFTGPRDVARLFRAVLATAQRRIERREGRTASESEALSTMLEHFLAVWGHPRVPRSHAVFERDGWRCTAPGCSSYRNLHDHHIRFRSAGGSDDLANRTTLCAWHHLRGVHAGTVRCRGKAPGALHFALGLRSNQPPLATYGPGEVVGHRRPYLSSSPNPFFNRSVAASSAEGCFALSPPSSSSSSSFDPPSTSSSSFPTACRDAAFAM